MMLRLVFCRRILAVVACWWFIAPTLYAQSLDEELRRVPATELVALAKSEGDAVRGAVVFFQPFMACSKCHSVGTGRQNGLGPDLTTLGPTTTDEHLVESVLLPSKVIRKGFESVTVVTDDGKTVTALLVERSPDKVVLRDVARSGESTTIPLGRVEDLKINATSIMPAGQTNQLTSRRQFLDLLRYLMEIRDGGATRAAQLQPPAALLTFTVPEYEKHLDHAGLIGTWNDGAFRRGEAIYQRVCANCHGTKDKLGSLPTSLRFAEGKFKNGSDPLSMYRTLTHGFGLMAPQTWMVPSQKYDVIHYIRETYLRPHNPTQFVSLDNAYLARLPQGDTHGPEPSKIEPWSAMDYGPSLAHTYEVPGLEHNLAYKGIAVRLDPGAGGVSRGRHWMVFDTDTLRVAAAWNGTGGADNNFIDWQGIQFNGAHGVHPRLVGQTAFVNSTGPGWADPMSGQFRDDKRVEGRDGKRYGPLPRKWAKFHGLYHHGSQVIFRYTVGTTEILESPRIQTRDEPQAGPLFLRTFYIGPREQDLWLQVAEHPAKDAAPKFVRRDDKSVVQVAPPESNLAEPADQRLVFDGNTYLEVVNDGAFDLTTQDFSVVARIKTKTDGTIWSLTRRGPKWTPDGQTFFVRSGRLGFDIGWVGAVTARSKVADGRWHDVAVTWQKSERRVQLYVDGKLDGEGTLSAKAALPESIVRIGFTSPDFPRPATFFQGDVAQVRFYQRRLSDAQTKLTAEADQQDSTLVGWWKLERQTGTRVADGTGRQHDADVRRGMAPVRSPSGPLVAGFAPRDTEVEWSVAEGRLRLRIPAGKKSVRFTVWQPSEAADAANPVTLADLPIPDAADDLSELTHGGPSRWPQKLETQIAGGSEAGPFAVDVLTPPETNPWLAQLRFTGLDFFPDGRLAVCTWDGDVWTVEVQPNGKLIWQRIATGLFQPLGLKIVEGRIHVICRDQLAVLHDLNGDGEVDFYECLNNDHQVTEHFHEFAMGLQTDAQGNFYYAKSGRHGLPAVVPHHGTLLRIHRDGSQTDILATGFRAANGVCLNPDGSFVVTDQEGFWNPKNRINWVELAPSGKPKFYGNLFGYTDVTDPSDAAMEPPLCWITNTFDRSPAELLWVDSKRWGPLNGSLLNLSYGNGKVFLVPHERVRGVVQGGMIELPVPPFPTGVMRGRFHPTDGELYLCGMFAWAGNATQPGGLYRLRATGRPMHLPVGLSASKSGITLTFTEPLDRTSITAKNTQIKTWSLKRSANYGSKHFDEKQLVVRDARLAGDSRTVQLDIPDIQPTWGMEIKFEFTAENGVPVVGVIHNTIHHLAD